MVDYGDTVNRPYRLNRSSLYGRGFQPILSQLTKNIARTQDQENNLGLSKFHRRHSWLCERVSTEGFGIASRTQLENPFILRVQQYHVTLIAGSKGLVSLRF